MKSLKIELADLVFIAGYTVACASLAVLWNISVRAQTLVDKPLSEISQLKKQNLDLKAQLTQCSVNLASIKSSQELTTEQKKLVDEFSKELGCSFNWATGKCDVEKTVNTVTATTGPITTTK